MGNKIKRIVVWLCAIMLLFVNRINDVRAWEPLTDQMLEKLKKGETVSVNGSWTVNGMLNSPDEYYDIKMQYQEAKNTLIITNAGGKNDVVPEISLILNKEETLLSAIKNIELVGFEVIGYYAFGYMPALETVDFSKSQIVRIRDYAFANCSKLNQVELPDTLEHIGDYAFWNSNVSKVTLPDSLITIGSDIFRKCDNVNIRGLKTNKYYALKNNCLYEKLSGELIGVSTGDIGTTFTITNPEIVSFNCILSSNVIKYLDLSGSNMEVLKDYVLSGNKTLKAVYLPSTCHTLEDGCFYESAVEKIYGLENVTVFGERVFGNCEKLDGNLILNDDVHILPQKMFYQCKSLSNVTLPKELEEIEDGVFYGCKNLHTINLPETLQKLGSCAFANCTSLKQIDFPNKLEEIENSCFSGCSMLAKVDTNKVKVLGESAFYNCTSLEEVIIKDALEVLQKETFVNTNISTITLGKGLEEIEENVFGEQDIQKIIVKSLKTNLPKEKKNSGVYQAALFAYKDSVAIKTYKELGYTGVVTYLDADKEPVITTECPVTDVSTESPVSTTEKQVTEASTESPTSTTEKQVIEVSTESPASTTEKQVTEVSTETSTSTTEKQVTEASTETSTSTTEKQVTEVSTESPVSTTEKQVIEVSTEKPTSTTEKQVTEVSTESPVSTTEKRVTEESIESPASTTEKRVTEESTEKPVSTTEKRVTEESTETSTSTTEQQVTEVSTESPVSTTEKRVTEASTENPTSTTEKRVTEESTETSTSTTEQQVTEVSTESPVSTTEQQETEENPENPTSTTEQQQTEENPENPTSTTEQQETEENPENPTSTTEQQQTQNSDLHSNTIANKVTTVKTQESNTNGSEGKTTYQTPVTVTSDSQKVKETNFVKKRMKIKSCKQKGKKCKIQCKKMKNAKKYEMQYSTKKSFQKKVSDTKKGTAFVIKEMKKKQIYYVRVRAIDSHGNYSKWSRVKKFSMQ